MSNYNEKVCKHWQTRGGIEAIEEALKKKGLTLKEASPQDLAVHDQLHAGVLEATAMVANWAKIRPNSTVLDLGSGKGGSARFLVRQYDCQVTAVDLSPELSKVAQAITQSQGLDSKICHLCADYNAIEERDFDLIWIQHVDMQVPDKKELYQQIASLVSNEGKAVWHDWLAGSNAPVKYPVMWSEDGSLSSVIGRKDFENQLIQAGLKLIRYKDMSSETTAWFEALATEINRVISKLSRTDLRLKRLNIRKEYVDNILINIGENRLVPFLGEATKSA